MSSCCSGNISTSVVIDNIPQSVTQEEIESRLGVKPYALTIGYPNGLGGCGKGFVDFYRAEEASIAIRAINGTTWNGHEVRASYQKIPHPTTRPPCAPDKAKLPAQRPPYDSFGPIASVGFTPPQSSIVVHQFDKPTQSHAGRPFERNIRDASLRTTNSGWTKRAPAKELDLNDPWTLEMFTRILLFMNDTDRRDSLVFPPTFTSQERYTVHLLAQKLGVHHDTASSVEGRSVVVTLEKEHTSTVVAAA